MNLEHGYKRGRSLTEYPSASADRVQREGVFGSLVHRRPLYKGNGDFRWHPSSRITGYAVSVSPFWSRVLGLIDSSLSLARWDCRDHRSFIARRTKVPRIATSVKNSGVIAPLNYYSLLPTAG